MDKSFYVNQQLVAMIEDSVAQMKEHYNAFSAEDKFSNESTLHINNGRMMLQNLYAVVCTMDLADIRPDVYAYTSVVLEEMNQIMCAMEQHFRSLLLLDSEFVKNLTKKQ